MKSNAMNKKQANQHIVTVKQSYQQQSIVDTEIRQQNREFIKAMNEICTWQVIITPPRH